MNEPNSDVLEQQLSKLPLAGAPSELRSRILAGVHRELGAAKWDRRLARAAAVLLVVGAGMNALIGLRGDGAARHSQIAAGLSQESLVDAAVAVAEATDAETGRQYARHLAALGGQRLSPEQAGGIDAAIEQRATRL